MQYSNKNINFFLAVLFTYRIIVTVMVGISSISSTAVNITTVVLCYMLLLNGLGTGKFLNTIKKYYPLYLFFILDSIVDFFNGYSATGLDILLYKLLQEFLWPILIVYAISGNEKKLAKYLLFVFSVCYAITCFTTYFGNVEYPGASRALARLTEEGDMTLYAFYKALNIGGVEFIYQLVLMIPLLIYMIKQSIKSAVLGSLLAFCFISTIIISEYTTALVFSIASVLLFFIREEKNFKKLIITLVFVLSFSYVLIYYVDIFDILSNIVPSGSVAERLSDISTSIHGGSVSGGDLDKRQYHWNTSIDMFFSSPIWGTGKYGGEHSFWLDHLAKYGSIGIILSFIVIRKMYQLTIKEFHNTPFLNYMLFILFAEIGLMLFNPYQHLQIFSFFVPIFSFVFNHSKYSKNV